MRATLTREDIARMSADTARRNEAMRATKTARAARRTAGADASTDETPSRSERAKTPNSTEARYYTAHLAPRVRAGELATVAYEGVSLKMLNGHRYTADWACWRSDGTMELHEVKGGYRLPSYQRARLAFDQVRIEFPQIVFVWHEEQGRKRKAAK